jgi:hypothetical protein
MKVIFFTSQMDQILADAIAKIAEDELPEGFEPVFFNNISTIEDIETAITHVATIAEANEVDVGTELKLQTYSEKLQSLRGFWLHRAEMWDANLKLDSRFKVSVATLWENVAEPNLSQLSMHIRVD